MVAIRLMRTGKKNSPYYRIVVQEARHKANGAYLESLGSYDPVKKTVVNVDHDRVRMWKSRGAAISARVRSVLKRAKAAQP